MKRALFVSKNLIGDALNIAPAWRAWWDLHRESRCEIDLVTHADHVAPLYSAMGVPANVITNLSQQDAVHRHSYDFVFHLDVSKAFEIGIRQRLHVTQAYAKMIGVKACGMKPVCLLDQVAYRGDDVEDGCILISPFSESCASRSGKAPNKMLPFATWAPVIDYMQTFERTLYVLGSRKDAPIAEFGLRSSQFLLGTHSLMEIARIMRDRAALLVTVDNGMSHLAASQDLPTLLFYPACLPMSWIVPRGNPHCTPMQLDPAKCSAAEVLRTAREVVPRLLEIRRSSRDTSRVDR
jgi:Glycosyltransferase family 9 (heptosyltransferase)